MSDTDPKAEYERKLADYEERKAEQEEASPPSAPQATGGTNEWARSPFDTGECCCNVHGEDGRLACPIHGLPARLPAAREARSDGSVSTVSDGETRERFENPKASSAVPTPPEAEQRIDSLIRVCQANAKCSEMTGFTEEQWAWWAVDLAALAADLATVTRERDGWKAAACDFHDALVGAGMAGAFNQRLCDRAVRTFDGLCAQSDMCHEEDRVEILARITGALERAEVAEQALRETKAK